MPISPNITRVVNVVFEEISTEEINNDMSKAHNMQHGGNCTGKNVIVSTVQMQIICNIPVLFGKWNYQANSIHRL